MLGFLSQRYEMLLGEFPRAASPMVGALERLLGGGQAAPGSGRRHPGEGVVARSRAVGGPWEKRSDLGVF